MSQSHRTGNGVRKTCPLAWGFSDGQNNVPTTTTSAERAIRVRMRQITSVAVAHRRVVEVAIRHHQVVAVQVVQTRRVRIIVTTRGRVQQNPKRELRGRAVTTGAVARIMTIRAVAIQAVAIRVAVQVVAVQVIVVRLGHSVLRTVGRVVGARPHMRRRVVRGIRITRVILWHLRGMKPHRLALGRGVVRRIRVARRTMVLAQGVVISGTDNRCLKHTQPFSTNAPIIF